MKATWGAHIIRTWSAIQWSELEARGTSSRLTLNAVRQRAHEKTDSHFHPYGRVRVSRISEIRKLPDRLQKRGDADIM